MYVYAIKFPNGKMYIGATTISVNKRFKEHIAAAKRVDSKFYRALNKYGSENVEVIEIKQFDTKEKMFNAEKILISRHKTNINGYNTTIGGEGASGIILTDEQRKKMSTSQLSRFQRIEERIKASVAYKKWYKENPDYVTKINKKRTEKVRSEEHRRKMSMIMTRLYKEKPEIVEKNKQGIINKYKNDPSIAQKISRSLGGKPVGIYKDNKLIKVYDTLRQCVRHFKLNPGNAKCVLKGKRNHVKGYQLKYHI